MLESLNHSTLGTANFAYNSADRLTTLTLGNNASTLYDYDSTGRLDYFDIRDGSAQRLLKHSWGYDHLNRKGNIMIASAAEAALDGQEIDLAYDGSSRLTQEHLTGSPDPWDIHYGYDGAGNRTSQTFDAPMTLTYTMTYGTGNREATASSGDGLTYDFKGNVATRSPLNGTDPTLTYSWNAWDRMTEATDSSSYAALYDYDALGRLLGKARINFSDWSLIATGNYWLGLNKIAESRLVGSADLLDTTVLRPDSESGDLDDPAAPAANGWCILGGSPDTMSYQNDDDRGKVLYMSGTQLLWGNGGWLIGDNPDSPTNPNYDKAGLQTPNSAAGLWFKNADSEHGGMIIGFVVEYDDGTSTGTAQMWFSTSDGRDGGSNPYLYYIGTGWNDGYWHYFEEDLQARLHELDAGRTLTKIDAVGFIGKEIYADDVQLAMTVMEKSYQVVPRSINYLAAQSGSGGGISQDAWAKWYYAANDLATSLVTTDGGGNEISVSEPDGFGNYREVLGTRPDTLGLDGKFFEADAGAYYFRYRWQDAERGRWLSKEPSGWDGPNLYHLDYNDPVNYYDPDGSTAEGAIEGGAIGGVLGGLVGGILGGAGGTLALPGGGTIVVGIEGAQGGVALGAALGGVIGNWLSNVCLAEDHTDHMGDNSKPNKQAHDAAKQFDLNKDQQRLLHDLLQGRDVDSFRDIVDIIIHEILE